MIRAMEAAERLSDLQDRNRATHIANAIAKMLKG